MEVHCTGGIPWISAVDWIRDAGIQTVGYDPLTAPAALTGISPGIQWIDRGGDLARLRIQKTRDEIACLREAADNTLAMLDALKTKLRDGITEKECAGFAAAYLTEMTGELPGFMPMVAFGENTAHPHWISGSRRLNPGDTIVIDCGAVVNGYRADISRTFFWKRASARQLRRYRIIWDALDRVIKNLAPSSACSTVDSTVRSALAQHHLDPYFPHSLGHGVGLSLHEPPYFSVDSEDELMVDMTFALEPGIFFPGWGGIRIEEMVWLSAAGPDILSRGAPEDGLLH